MNKFLETYPHNAPVFWGWYNEHVEADDEGALGALHDWHWMVD